MKDISLSQRVNCDLARRYVGLNLSQHEKCAEADPTATHVRQVSLYL